MAFDAGLLSFVVNEINNNCLDGKVEKIYQPTKDELIFLLRAKSGSHRLLINAGSRCPRISLTLTKPENPIQAPMLCMLFRKHLQGATFLGAEIVGFDRICRLKFDSYDDMGFKCTKTVVYELMGTYSNVILLDGENKIISAMRYVELSDKNTRVVLPGLVYENPPSQNKINPLITTTDDFSSLLFDKEQRADKFLLNTFSGLSPLITREISHLATGDSTANIGDNVFKIANSFFKVIDIIKTNSGSPSIVYNDNKPLDYSYLSISQYGDLVAVKHFESFAEMLDTWFETKTSEETRGHKARDVIKFLNSTESRIEKKLGLQKQELLNCDSADNLKLLGDLIISNIYLIPKKSENVKLLNYETGEYVSVDLDPKFTPSQNAQNYYKKYSKLKSAKNHLSSLIESAERELEYVSSVKDALSRCVTEKEISEIREELINAGYSSRIKNKKQSKKLTPSYLEFVTTNGFTVLCGKNNLANDYITFKKSNKTDWWFHVKNAPGSHVVMITNGNEPSEIDFTDCCTIAALYSSLSESPSVEIDYTKIKSVKKPPDSKPGYVIYHTNWSATVKNDKEKVASLLKK